MGKILPEYGFNYKAAESRIATWAGYQIFCWLLILQIPVHFCQKLNTQNVLPVPCLSLHNEVPWLTQPFTSVELHSHTHDHGRVGDGHEADEASYDGRFKILQNHVICILVALDNLGEEKQGAQFGYNAGFF